MELIGSGFRDDADHAAHELAEFRGGVIRDHVEFLDRVHIRRERHVVVHEFVVVHTVQQIVVGLLAVSIDVGPSGVEGGLAGVERRRAGGHRAGHQ